MSHSRTCLMFWIIRFVFFSQNVPCCFDRIFSFLLLFTLSPFIRLKFSLSSLSRSLLVAFAHQHNENKERMFSFLDYFQHEYNHDHHHHLLYTIPHTLTSRHMILSSLCAFICVWCVCWFGKKLLEMKQRPFSRLH